MTTLTIGQAGTGGTRITRLPQLREELNLYPGVSAFDGTPTWILQDPVAHRFYRLGWLEFELLSRWRAGNSHAVLQQVTQETTLGPTEDDLEQLLEFLITHNLLKAQGHQSLERLAEQAEKLTRRDTMWWLKNYLFLRIPLTRPDAFLTRTLRWVSWLGSRWFLKLTCCVALLGLYLVQQQWDSFLGTFPHFFSLQGLVLMGLALTTAKVMHELGHAYCAKHFGCRVPTMGVALLVLWPVLYTDASDAWRLTSRRQRLTIGAAGMITELSLAAYATLIWSLLPDGPLRSTVFLLATTTWVLTLLINLNPFMRFDGYYLLSDYLGIPNLQERAFALARWRLRESLFQFNEPIPEEFGQRTHRILLIYAYGTWIYRFFLFLGIALLVYFLFFKVLGILLMVAELAWFIGRPIYNELKAWHERRSRLSWNPATIRTVLLAAIVAGLLLFPWQRDLAAPALWRGEEHVRIYTPTAARVATIHARPGQLVEPGEPLFELRAPDLEHEIEQGKQQLALLEWQTQFRDLHRTLQERALVLQQELQRERSRQQGRLTEQERLVVRSPIRGVVRDRYEPLREGDWLPADEMLAVVVATHASTVEAWISETRLSQVKPGNQGRFFPDDLSRRWFKVTISDVDAASARTLPDAYLASTQGGPIAVREDRQGALIPEQPVYRVSAQPADDVEQAPGQIVLGTLRVRGDRESIARRIGRATWALLIRESGF